MKKLSVLSILLILQATSLFAQKTPVFATVDVQRVLNDYAAFQEAVEEVKTSMAPVEEEIKRMQENIQTIVTEGRELESSVQNPALDEEAKEKSQEEISELKKELQKDQVEFNSFRQQAQQLAQQSQQEEIAPLQEKAVEAVKQVATDKGIDIVIPLNVAVFVSDDLEITDAVIAVLNAGE